MTLAQLKQQSRSASSLTDDDFALHFCSKVSCIHLSTTSAAPSIIVPTGAVPSSTSQPVTEDEIRKHLTKLPAKQWSVKKVTDQLMPWLCQMVDDFTHQWCGSN
jgi:hypothetical protein